VIPSEPEFINEANETQLAAYLCVIASGALRAFAPDLWGFGSEAILLCGKP
jgi:hypothetical protein